VCVNPGPTCPNGWMSNSEPRVSQCRPLPQVFQTSGTVGPSEHQSLVPTTCPIPHPTAGPTVSSRVSQVPPLTPQAPQLVPLGAPTSTACQQLPSNSGPTAGPTVSPGSPQCRPLPQVFLQLRPHSGPPLSTISTGVLLGPPVQLVPMAGPATVSSRVFQCCPHSVLKSLRPYSWSF
jgi:hypothetical protein